MAIKTKIGIIVDNMNMTDQHMALDGIKQEQTCRLLRPGLLSVS